jgi:catechol 2,3-dioxygenase-like lactoylglutathione lyase family enzyme
MADIIAQSSVLLCRDVPEAMAFWRDVMGFAVDNTYGDPPGFAIMHRDGAWVMLGATDATVKPLREGREGLFDAYFWVNDASAEFERQKGQGGKSDYGPCLQPYGVLEFGMLTPDNHLIGFGQVIASVAA